jgi:hypothetical protein
MLGDIVEQWRAGEGAGCGVRPLRRNAFQTAGVQNSDMRLHPLVRIGSAAVLVMAAFPVGQQYPRTAAAQSRQKWEYQVVTSGFIGSRSQVEKLNQLGEDGWEAINLNAHDRVLLKRAK